MPIAELGSGDDSALARRMRSDQTYRCNVYAHHLLTPDNPQSMKNPKQTGFIQEEKFRTDYITPKGTPVYVTGNYVRERDGSKVTEFLGNSYHLSSTKNI